MANIDILCITEHWMTEPEIQSLHFPNYRIAAYNCRESYAHGGLLIITRQSLTTEVQNLSTYNKERCLELCSAVIPKLNSVIVTVYHPPNGDKDEMMERLEETLTYIKQTQPNKNLFVIGDYNICVNGVNENQTTKADFLVTMSEHGLHPIFSQPSRVGGKRCVDNMFADRYLHVQETETVNLHLGDHMAQIATFHLASTKENPKLGKCRKINDKTIQTFKTLLQTSDWTSIYDSENNAQTSYTLFHSLFMSCYNTAFPEMVMRKSTNDLNLKWMTKELEVMKNQLDALHTIIEVSGENRLKDSYNLLKKTYIHQIDDAKRKAYGKYISKSENKVTAAWKLVKRETGKSNKKQLPDSYLNADHLNTFFVNIGSSNPNRAAIADPINLVPVVGTRMGSFGQVEHQEITNIIKTLNMKNTKDVYGISVRLLNEIEPIISNHICKLINKCQSEGVFPMELKQAKVTPIHKKGDHNDSTNYRPISILPSISKVFEVVVKDKLIKYLAGNDLMTKYQHGYLQRKSTTTALLSIIHEIVQGFDQQQYTQIAFCDLSKAFDSVNHNVLIQKLERYGIEHSALKYIISYLHQRKQQVQWRGQRSQWKGLTTGVPQGSVLGPVLFLLYINDLPQNVPSQSICLYADDTSFINRSRDLGELKLLTDSVLQKAQNWFDTNELKLNTDKTKILTFHTKSANDASHQTMKFLGVVLSETLAWTEHIAYLKKRLANSLYCIKVTTGNLPLREARTVYFAYFHSIATYGMIAWGVSSELETIFKLQKKAIRTLAGLQHRDSCRNHFRKLKIITLPGCFILTCLEYVHARRDIIIKNADTHSYNTRYRDDISVPYHRITKSQKSYHYISVKLYNALPAEIKCFNNKKFKSKVREILMEGEFYSVAEFYNKYLSHHIL